MNIDPTNPIVATILAGIAAETAGRIGDARARFEGAWGSAADDYDACIAAHFLARVQPEATDRLGWNREAVARAHAVGDERVLGFYPSLYLNLGYSLEECGDRAEAARIYALAEAQLPILPPGPYGDVVRDGVRRALLRIASPGASFGA
jgi:hypothetical protein